MNINIKKFKRFWAIFVKNIFLVYNNTLKFHAKKIVLAAMEKVKNAVSCCPLKKLYYNKNNIVVTEYNPVKSTQQRIIEMLPSSL